MIIIDENIISTSLCKTGDVSLTQPFQFDNRPGLSRRDVIKESIQVANIADLVSSL